MMWSALFLLASKEFKFFNIYSRYGELVFTTADPSRGWDGYYKGVRQAPGTYVWQTEGIGYDGRLSSEKELLF